MSKNFYRENKEIDYYKSLNKIMVLSLTGMATLGASMLIMESTKSEASPLKTATTLLAKNVLKLPAIKPVTSNPKVNITRLNIVRTLSLKPGISTGNLLSSVQKIKLNVNQNSGSSLTPIKTPTIVSSASSLSNVLKPKK